MLWIDEATGKIVDRSSAPACRSVVDEVRRAVHVISRRPHEANRVSIDLVGHRPPLTIDGCDVSFATLDQAKRAAEHERGGIALNSVEHRLVAGRSRGFATPGFLMVECEAPPD
jgi:hypothetical protein